VNKWRQQETPRKSRDYFENPCSNKLKNLEEMDTFLDICDHPKLNQKDINQLNRCITPMKLKQQ
jgi:hypothetical protein